MKWAMSLAEFLQAHDIAANSGIFVNNSGSFGSCAIEDVEYEELEPDPNDGPAPMATLVYNPKK